jgi:hypothetical protein
VYVLMQFLVKLRFTIALALTMCAGVVCAATLERLSLADMIAKSTAIVRGKVVSCYAASAGPIVYTHYSVQVSERYKGSAGTTVDVAVPGGTVNGLRQTFAGTPAFNPGEEYVFFLWTGKSGITQVIGLTQGLFAVARDSSGDPMLTRAATRELTLDSATGRPAPSERLTMHVSELRALIASALAGAK